MLDDNSDELLTKEEITEGLKMLHIDLTAEEYNLLMNAIDENADGVISLQEWE
jgi:Ca2+-binding EF-hand superfamily protein